LNLKCKQDWRLHSKLIEACQVHGKCNKSHFVINKLSSALLSIIPSQPLNCFFL
jgi:hypothetical protein